MSLVPQFPRNDPDIVYETIEGETILINLKSGSYYCLMGVGSMVWTELETGRTLDEILTQLYGDYDAGPQEIETAVRQLLESLVQEGLLTFETPEALSPSIRLAAADLRASTTPKPKFQAPRLQKFTDMQELLLLDPVHEVDETGWPLAENRVGA